MGLNDSHIKIIIINHIIVPIIFEKNLSNLTIALKISNFDSSLINFAEPNPIKLPSNILNAIIDKI